MRLSNISCEVLYFHGHFYTVELFIGQWQMPFKIIYILILYGNILKLESARSI